MPSWTLRTLPDATWVAVAIFGLATGTLVLLLDGALTDRIIWLSENFRTGASSLSAQNTHDVTQGVQVWGWTGIAAGALSLLLGHPRVRRSIISVASRPVERIARPLPLPRDGYGGAFLLAAGGVLVFTGLAHWSLTAYKDVGWFGGEDGAREW